MATFPDLCLVTASPSPTPYGLAGALAVRPIAGEAASNLVQRALQEAAGRTVLVDAMPPAEAASLLWAFEALDELLLTADSPTPLGLLTCFDAGRWEAFFGLQDDTPGPAAGFLTRLRQAGCADWLQKGLLSLPQSQDAVSEALVRLRDWWQDHAGAIAAWRQAAAGDALEQGHRLLRHGLGARNGLRGIARLLLGALTSDRSTLTANEVAWCLQRLCPDHAAETGERLQGERTQRLLALAAPNGSPTPLPSAPPPLETLDLLLVDEDPQAAENWSRGLKLLAESLQHGEQPLCRQANITSLAPQDALRHDCEPDLILLGYNLGEAGDIKDVLPGLKAKWPFCPVVMLTHCDRLEVAQWCLSYGASGFFVKEPADDRERRSDRHFDRLADLLLSLDGRNGLYQGLWTREHLVRRACNEVRALAPQLQAWDQVLARQHLGAVSHQLSTVLGLLLAPGTEYALTAGTTAKDRDLPRWHQVCTCLLRAEELLQEALCFERGKRRPGLNSAQVWVGAGGGPASQVRDASPWQGLAEELGWASVDQQAIRLFGERRPWEATIGHGEGARTTLDFEPHVAEVLGRTLVAFRLGACHSGGAGEVPSPLAWATSAAPAPVAAGTSHAETARLGARGLVASLTPETAPTLPPGGPTLLAEMDRLLASAPREVLGAQNDLKRRCLWLVDDDPDGDYPQVLRHLLEACGAQVQLIPYLADRMGLFTASASDLPRPDVVLVDLNMPDGAGRATPAGGLEAIRKARGSISAAVPLAVLTGSTDSLNLAACIAAGAQDYIPKRFEGRHPAPGRVALLKRIARLSRLADWMHPLRAVQEDDESVPGSLQALQMALTLPQDALWRPQVIAALTGKAAQPSYILEDCGRVAAAAWGNLLLTAQAGAPDDARLPQREDPWREAVTRLAPGIDTHRRARLGMVALGNLFEPIVRLLYAACLGQAPQGASRFRDTLSGLRASSTLADASKRLQEAGREDLAAALRGWLSVARDAYTRRSNWEHAKETADERSLADTPRRIASLLRECFAAAAGLAEAASVLTQ